MGNRLRLRWKSQRKHFRLRWKRQRKQQSEEALRKAEADASSPTTRWCIFFVLTSWWVVRLTCIKFTGRVEFPFGVHRVQTACFELGKVPNGASRGASRIGRKSKWAHRTLVFVL